LEFHNEDIMILAKTKPTPSKNNGALICTAGINSNGEWRRLYPIRWDTFFRKNNLVKFRKWDIINVPIIKSDNDSRKSSYKIRSRDEIKLVDRLDNTRGRCGIIKDYLYPSVKTLWNDNVNRSTTILKPKRITKIWFTKSSLDNGIMPRNEAAPSDIPDIRIRWLCNDPNCRTYHNMTLLDWEFTETLRKNINEFGDEEGKARTAETIWSLYSKRDMYFVLGNSWDYYRWPKKWFIIGLIHVPRNCVNTWEW
jgi:hypothetical protein